MDFDSRLLQKKLAEWLRWERRKRRERTGAALVFYALLLALLTQPLYVWGSLSTVRWFVPIIFLGVLAPLFFLRHRWRSIDSVRALARLDKTLGLDERALTSWELLARQERDSAALLVLKQAQDQAGSMDPKALSRRNWSWHAYASAPLLCFWLTVSWFGLQWHVDTPRPAAPAIAYELREFSRQLQDKAKSEGLKDTLLLGRELENVAQKSIESRTLEERLKNELAGIAKKIEAAGRAAAESSFTTEKSEHDLRDLRAELEAVRDFLGSEQAKAGGDAAADRFAGLPQLKRQLDNLGESGRSLGQEELKAYLDGLEDQVAQELDRRALLDAQRFLDQLARKDQGDESGNEIQVAGRRGQPALKESEEMKGHGSLPGDEPGSSAEVFELPQKLDRGAPAQLKGQLGEGVRSSLIYQGTPSSGKSEVSEDELIASYQRRAEADLNREQVPEGLRELIKNYFLSLGAGEERP